MQIPLSWLKEFVDIDIPPELLAEKLTTAGLEVGGITYIGVPQTDPAQLAAQYGESVRYPKSDHLVWDTSRLLWGAVLEVNPHPNADRLVLALVDYGAAEPEQCVTGAPNLFEYKGLGRLPAPLYTVIALEGAEVWDGHSDEPKRMILKEKPLRGIPNRSMVCSEKELGISDEHEGIMLFHDNLGHAPGTPATDVLGDVVFNIELTPNLARCYSVLGVAREIAALLDKPLRLPDYTVHAAGAPIDGAVTIEIRSPQHNPRFTVMLLRDITLKPSPDWMQRRLRLCGQRPISNIVDITNYVMFEIGQPLHAFDYDKLVARAGGAIPHLITRLAYPGEMLKTLDGKERALAETDIVIADNRDQAISLAAVMGGFDTEIGDDTRNVLLEAANWDFISVRRTTHTHKLFSEAGTRFSRGVHPSQTVLGVQRGIELMRQTSGGTVSAGMVDVYLLPAPVIAHTLTTDEIARIMGMTFSAEEAAALLRRGGFAVEVRGAALHVTVPDHRLDIDRDPVIGAADLIEEIARISGYSRIPTTIIADEMPKQRPNPALEREELARDLLVALGLRENISYRMTTPEREAQLVPAGMTPGFETDAETYVRLANPISAEKTVLRHTLLVSLLENARNSARYADRIQIFEIGSIYLRRPGQALPDEPRRLGLLLAGARGAPSWLGGDASAVDFYDLKGVVEGLLAGLHVRDIAYTRAAHTSFHPGRSAELRIGGQYAGVLGELHPGVAATFGFEGAALLAAELDLDIVLAAADPLHRVRPLPVTPSVYQDIALVVRDEVSAAEVERVIRMVGGKLLRSVMLFDVYTGDPVPAGHRSIAYALAYGTDERTLTDKEVAALHTKIVKACERELAAVLRA
jgi:phenylalanyl-tRNA synthetase beta chain